MSIRTLIPTLLVAVASFGQPDLEFQPIASGLDEPIFVTAPPGDMDRLFVVERRGVIHILENGALLPTPFLDIEAQFDDSSQEEGLLGLAFHPDYATNGHFYVNYIRTPSTRQTYVARFTVSSNANIANAASQQILLTYEQPESNHNAGMMAFGPNDGYLYIASGDGGGANDRHGDIGNGQDFSNLLGAILRISVDELPGEGSDTGGVNYDIPPDNPLVDTPGAAPEIWAYGLRNPWRFSFDRANGDMYIGDVGQNTWEEIDYQPAASEGGENYGWRIAEGFECRGGGGTCGTSAGFTPPVHVYARNSTHRSVTGGYVYRGNAIPSLQGAYFFSDYVGAQIWTFAIDNGSIVNFQERTDDVQPSKGGTIRSIASYGEDAAGELYLVSLSGTVYQLVDLNQPEGEGQTEGEGEGIPPAETHTADTSGNRVIELTELLRVIQLYNSSEFHCDATTEDGYAPGPGDRTCASHDSDYNAQDWAIALTELLRLIQIFNSPGYVACPEQATEDGYCLDEM